MFASVAYREEFVCKFKHEAVGPSTAVSRYHQISRLFFSSDDMNKLRMGPSTAVSRYHQISRLFFSSDDMNKLRMGPSTAVSRYHQIS